MPRNTTTRQPRLALYSHAPSDSINLLKDELVRRGVNVVKVKRNNSTFVGRQGDILFNYGSSSMPTNIIGQARVLNNPARLEAASNKLRSFQRLQEEGIPTVEWTSDSRVAQGWLDEGVLVYARTRLQGHSGEGIQLAYNNPTNVGDAGEYAVSQTLPRAQLYTKAIMGNRREFRIHVMNGVITYTQQKRRRDGYREDGNYSNLVRNHASGWIYATQNIAANSAAQSAAIQAVAALGLDFGAVDVITNREDAWVLEVNTAPGMSGTNLETYTNNLIRLLNGEEVEGSSVDVTELQQEINDASSSRQQSQPTSNTTQTQRNAASAQATTTQAQVPPAPTQRDETVSTLNQPRGRAEEFARHQNSTPVDEAFYWLTVNGERTIGQYNSDNEHFLIIGWEVPVERADATLGSRIN